MLITEHTGLAMLPRIDAALMPEFAPVVNPTILDPFENSNKYGFVVALVTSFLIRAELSIF